MNYADLFGGGAAGGGIGGGGGGKTTSSTAQAVIGNQIRGLGNDAAKWLAGGAVAVVALMMFGALLLLARK